MKRSKRVKETLGPGTYNIKDFLQEKRPSSLRGVCDTRERRFRDVLRDCYPGPGTYSPRGDPCAGREEPAARSASSRGLMDSRTPQRVLPMTLGSGLGPASYNLPNSIDELLGRVVSTRGPYDLFSGNRSEPAGRGHRAREQRGAELSPRGAKSFLEELTSRDNKKKGRFSTVPREPGHPAERIFWATLSQCPRDAFAAGPGSYDPKAIERSEYFNQPPFWSSAKRFDRKSCRLFAGNELPHPCWLCDDEEPHVTLSFQNPVGAGRYNITRHEKYPCKIRYQSLYQCETRRYLSNLERDAYLLERLKPSIKNNWNDLIAAPHCPDTSEAITAVF
ncbi:ciliary microtubule-associated protein 2 isoform X2 [Struthio camelus]|uniref:ciliary microtubule-associated protein 2 isoform X2 n=1 Tax=Struthio camelus TaxID=8801 RepID=UPI003603FDE6